MDDAVVFFYAEYAGLRYAMIMPCSRYFIPGGSLAYFMSSYTISDGP